MLPIRVFISLGLLAGLADAAPRHPSAPQSHPSKWDGRYILQSVAGGELCPKVGAMPLIVANGAFSYPWRLQASTLVKVGTIDGVIANNGKVSTTVKLDHPYPDAVASLSPDQLDAVKTVPIVFSGTKYHTAKLTLELGPKLRCSVVWATPGTPDPADERVAAPPPPKQNKPSRPAPSAPPPERSRPSRAEPSPPPPAPAPAAPPPPSRHHENRHSDCVGKCWGVEDTLKSRCEQDESTCHSECEREEHVSGECLSKCSSVEDTCKDRASQDGQTCVFGCPSDDD